MVVEFQGKGLKVNASWPHRKKKKNQLRAKQDLFFFSIVIGDLAGMTRIVRDNPHESARPCPSTLSKMKHVI